jgi:hydrogenase maturation protein HypF
VWQIGVRPLLHVIVKDLQRGVFVETIGRRFHNDLLKTLAQLVGHLRQRSSLNPVCLSGGSIQNELMLAGLIFKLTDGGFEVFTHTQVPAGDGGPSFGQAVIAAHKCNTILGTPGVAPEKVRFTTSQIHF